MGRGQTHTRTILSAIFVLTCLADIVHAQTNLSTAKGKAFVTYSPEPAIIAAGKQTTVPLHFHSLSGYHINSHTPHQDYLIATEVTLQPASGIQIGKLEYPAGTPYSFSFDPTEKLDVYTGDFTVNARIIAPKGTYTLLGTLHYQACDNAACYPPKTLPIVISITAK